MSNKLQNFVSLHKVAASDSSRTTSASSIRGKCFGSLFRCFKLSRKRESERYFDNCEHQDYNYIVEKLVVKRVPFALFEMPKNVSETKTGGSENDSLKQQLVAEGNTMHSNISETQSLLYYSDSLIQNAMPTRIPNKSLYSDTNTSALNERNSTNVLFSDYNARITELMNTMTSLHPDLKDSERPPKDPSPLNEPKNKTMPFKDFTEINSNQKSVNKSDGSYVQQTFMMPVTSVLEPNLTRKEGHYLRSPAIKFENEEKVYNPRQEQNACLSESENINDSKHKEVFIVQPIEDMFRNLTNFETTIINTNQSIMKEYDHKQAKIKPQSHSKLLRGQDQETFAIESKTLTENIAIADLPPVKLRWRIIVKHRKRKP